MTKSINISELPNYKLANELMFTAMNEKSRGQKKFDKLLLKFKNDTRLEKFDESELSKLVNSVSGSGAWTSELMGVIRVLDNNI